MALSLGRAFSPRISSRKELFHRAVSSGVAPVLTSGVFGARSLAPFDRLGPRRAVSVRA
jgi:hypothetical protein